MGGCVRALWGLWGLTIAAVFTYALFGVIMYAMTGDGH
jgi:hypothetical protein